MSDGNNTLVAKLLDGDPQAFRLLRLIRDFPPAEAEAFVRCGERIRDGMPVVDAAMRFYRECGVPEDKARRLVAQVTARCGGTLPLT